MEIIWRRIDEWWIIINNWFIYYEIEEIYEGNIKESCLSWMNEWSSLSLSIKTVESYLIDEGISIKIYDVIILKNIKFLFILF